MRRERGHQLTCRQRKEGGAQPMAGPGPAAQEAS